MVNEIDDVAKAVRQVELLRAQLVDERERLRRRLAQIDDQLRALRVPQNGGKRRERNTVPKEVLGAIEDLGGHATHREIMEAIPGMTKNHLSVVLSRYVKKGLIAQDTSNKRRHTYSVVKAPMGTLPTQKDFE